VESSVDAPLRCRPLYGQLLGVKKNMLYVEAIVVFMAMKRKPIPSLHF
jgi:hypothetical protein